MVNISSNKKNLNSSFCSCVSSNFWSRGNYVEFVNKNIIQICLFSNKMPKRFSDEEKTEMKEAFEIFGKYTRH